MKIAIIGYGKMGHMIESVALERGHEITCVIDANPSPTLPTREGEKVYSPEEGFESEGFRSADVAIEFTTPQTAESNVRKAWEQGVPVVCGSTGWNVEELKDESLECREVASEKLIVDKQGKTKLIWSSNYSVGVNIFFELNKMLAAKMAEQPQYTPSISETHHIHKLDKPSGTAKTLAQQIEANGRMANGECPIESFREGEVPGTHVVTWDSEEDTIVITHIAKGRRGFALGAVLAAEKIYNI